MGLGAYLREKAKRSITSVNLPGNRGKLSIFRMVKTRIVGNIPEPGYPPKYARKMVEIKTANKDLWLNAMMSRSWTVER